MKNVCVVVVLSLALMSVALQAAPPAGKDVYDKTCKTCHGPEGQGVPGIAKVMKVTIRHLGSKEVQAKSDEALRKDITQGTGKMKPVTTLSKQQLSDVIAFVRTLKQ